MDGVDFFTADLLTVRLIGIAAFASETGFLTVDRVTVVFLFEDFVTPALPTFPALFDLRAVFNSAAFFTATLADAFFF